MRHSISHAACTVVFLLATTAAAQQQPDRSIRPLQHVRLHTTSDTLFEGIIVRHDVTSVTLRSRLGQRSYPWADVDTVWTGRRPAVTGALIGGGIGLLPVALTCGRSLGGCGLDRGLLIAGAGAFIGGVIGGMVPRWKRVYPE